ncbi:MAG: hydroxymethylbilane synthase [Chloroflexota bacterium]
MNYSQPIRFGTRGSQLARWQTDYIQTQLQNAWQQRISDSQTETNLLLIETQVISTKGDQVIDTPLPLIGGKGLFTQALEAALYEQTIDAAVHSLKDLPTASPPGLTIGAIPVRANAADVLVSRNNHTLDTLPKGAQIGTSSLRRAAQLRYHRPDINIIDIRGNIDTRIRKGTDPDGPYDAIVLAQAGLERMGWMHVVSQELPVDVMLPAPGQGALAVQCRIGEDNHVLSKTLAMIRCPETTTAVTAERAFLAGLEGGCSVPIAAYATVDDGQLSLHGRVTAVDGSQQIDVTLAGAMKDADSLGHEAAQMALSQGARVLVDAKT